MPELSNLQNAVLLAAIGAVAFLYSSVGHGGATGYLAVMALLGTHSGAHRWRAEGFRRALAVGLWTASAKLVLTGK